MKLRYFLLAALCISATLSEAMWARLSRPLITRFTALPKQAVEYSKPAAFFTAGIFSSLSASALYKMIKNNSDIEYDCSKDIARMHQKAVKIGSYGASIDDPQAAAKIFSDQAQQTFIRCQRTLSVPTLQQRNIHYATHAMDAAIENNEYRDATAWRRTIHDLQQR